MRTCNGSSETEAGNQEVSCAREDKAQITEAFKQISKYIRAAYLVMRQADVSLTHNELGRLAVEGGHLDCTPERASNILAHLLYALNRSGCDSLFISPQPGRWKLDPSRNSRTGVAERKVPDEQEPPSKNHKEDGEDSPDHASAERSGSAEESGVTAAERSHHGAIQLSSGNEPGNDETEGEPVDAPSKQAGETRPNTGSTGRPGHGTDARPEKNSDTVVENRLLSYGMNLLKRHEFPVHYQTIWARAVSDSIIPRPPDVEGNRHSLSLHNSFYEAWLYDRLPGLSNTGMGYWGTADHLPGRSSLNRIYHEAASRLVPVTEIGFAVLRKLPKLESISAKAILDHAEERGISHSVSSAGAVEEAVLREIRAKGGASRYVQTREGFWKARRRYPADMKSSDYDNNSVERTPSGSSRAEEEAGQRAGRETKTKSDARRHHRPKSRHLEMIVRVLAAHGRPMDRLALLNSLRKRYGEEACDEMGLDFQRLTQIIQQNLEGHSNHPKFKKHFGQRIGLA